jgi:hypothetical protein
MKKHQRLVLILGGLSIVLMGLFPPWQRMDRFNASRPSGYSFVLQEPRRPIDDVLGNAPVVYRIDLSQLTLQWTLVLVMMGIVLLFLRMRQDSLEERAVLRPRRG